MPSSTLDDASLDVELDELLRAPRAFILIKTPTARDQHRSRTIPLEGLRRTSSVTASMSKIYRVHLSISVRTASAAMGGTLRHRIDGITSWMRRWRSRYDSSGTAKTTSPPLHVLVDLLCAAHPSTPAAASPSVPRRSRAQDQDETAADVGGWYIQGAMWWCTGDVPFGRWHKCADVVRRRQPAQRFVRCLEMEACVGDAECGTRCGVSGVGGRGAGQVQQVEDDALMRREERTPNYGEDAQKEARMASLETYSQTFILRKWNLEFQGFRDRSASQRKGSLLLHMGAGDWCVGFGASQDAIFDADIAECVFLPPPMLLLVGSLSVALNDAGREMDVHLVKTPKSDQLGLGVHFGTRPVLSIGEDNQLRAWTASSGGVCGNYVDAVRETLGFFDERRWNPPHRHPLQFYTPNNTARRRRPPNALSLASPTHTRIPHSITAAADSRLLPLGHVRSPDFQSRYAPGREWRGAAATAPAPAPAHVHARARRTPARAQNRPRAAPASSSDGARPYIHTRLRTRTRAYTYTPRLHASTASAAPFPPFPTPPPLALALYSYLPRRRSPPTAPKLCVTPRTRTRARAFHSHFHHLGVSRPARPAPAPTRHPQPHLLPHSPLPPHPASPTRTIRSPPGHVALPPRPITLVFSPWLSETLTLPAGLCKTAPRGVRTRSDARFGRRRGRGRGVRPPTHPPIPPPTRRSR
ncbi:hypothetical protein K438DRAFT_1781095 [Mycena galopus ATCC 62051]|nr:hypothetical protein K438DRAFT_1781095 [Mycena galopus ATCC 62051]